ncbi:MAG: ATP-binding cassette domain-containing protein [Synergistaceae bacterium]|jgi:macrolide transport system ATP-binding/permease protein|nr:ATP-binding cassette domain-containing protein [Synergistaceae bacterium]
MSFSSFSCASCLLRAFNIRKSYGDRVILDIDSLALYGGSKIGLVGQNGAGKSTLMAVLAGSIEPDCGRTERSGIISVIRQSQDSGLLRAERSDTAQRERRAFSPGPLSQNPSGGELTRAAIDAALKARPDILFADEPTTNLDMDGIRRLEGELRAFRGAIVLVSHDRALLDAVCGEIWHLEGGHIRTFPGSYTAWLEQSARERDFALFEYDAYRREGKRLREAARKLNERSKKCLKPPSRMSPSEARINPDKGQIGQAAVRANAKAISKRASMLEKKERPSDLPEIKMALGVSSRVASPVTIRASGLSVYFGDRVLLDNADFEIPTGKRTILLGPNGSGKTTILDLIARGAAPVKIAPGTRIGFFRQNHETLDPARTILENARLGSILPEHEVRTILARLWIKGDEAHKKCGPLSGGERAKAAFAALFASDLNTLILDEPTNHIDLYTAESLQDLLMAWKGTLLLVTHDRRLAEATGDRLLIIKERKIKTFEGPLWDYAGFS